MLGNHCTSLALYSTKDGQLLKNVILRDAIWEDEHVRDVVFSNDNHYMAVTYSNKVQLFDFSVAYDMLPTFCEIQTIETDFEFLGGVTFNISNDKLLISTLDHNNVLVYSILDRKRVDYNKIENDDKWRIGSNDLCFKSDGCGFHIIDKGRKSYTYCSYDCRAHIIPSKRGEYFAYKQEDEIIVSSWDKTIVFKKRIKDIESFDLSSDGRKLIVLDNQSLWCFDIPSGNVIDVVDQPKTNFNNRNIHLSGSDNWVILQDMFDRVLVFSLTNNISLNRKIERAFDAIISDDDKYIGIHWRFYNEYFSIEEIQTGRYLFSTKRHVTSYSGGFSISAGFNSNVTELMVSSGPSYEIYDVESNQLIDLIKNTNGGVGYWYENGFYSIGENICYYPMESLSRKINYLLEKIGDERMNSEEKKRYGIK